MLQIVAGSYDGHLLGYKCPSSQQKQDQGPVQHLFAFAAHSSCVRDAAAAQHILVTSSTDISIGVHDLKKNRTYGNLNQEFGAGAINSLDFFSTTHLLAGADDGDVSVWRTSDWECLLRMKGHKGPVHCVSVHPSGRLALSVADDSKLMLWNLMSGKCNYTVALSQPARLVLWAPGGDTFIVGTGAGVELHTLQGSSAPYTLSHKGGPPLAASFASPNLLITGGEKVCGLQLWNVDSRTRIRKYDSVHVARIKAIESIVINGQCVVVTGSSDGSINVWKVIGDLPAKAMLESLHTISTRVRLTCLAVSLASVSSQRTITSYTHPRSDEESDESERGRISTGNSAFGAKTQPPEEKKKQKKGEKKVRAVVQRKRREESGTQSGDEPKGILKKKKI